jgi:lipopolysaccharide/colanic/teichoic acid biosynthesis glycosyltransferase
MNLRAHQPLPETIIGVRELPRIPAWKRAIDLACCIVALPFLCLVTVLMAIALKLSSPGPVLFKQERVGYKGKRFKCYKFRTMAVGADTKGHQAHYDNLVGSKVPMVKLDSKGDSRLIPGGWLLRATGLDELPQIINIYQGEMSLVGPRPCLQYEYEKYEPWHRDRLNAVPGLTGLWQVSGKNRTTFDEMVRLDIRYSETRSFLLDLKIILMTAPALLVQVSDTHQARKNSREPSKKAAQRYFGGRNYQTPATDVRTIASNTK